MGIASRGVIPCLLPIVDSPLHLTPPLEVDGQAGGDLSHLRTIPRLQAPANAAVQFPAPGRPQPLVEHLPIQRMREPVAPTAGPIRPRPQAQVGEKVLL